MIRTGRRNIERKNIGRHLQLRHPHAPRPRLSSSLSIKISQLIPILKQEKTEQENQLLFLGSELLPRPLLLVMGRPVSSDRLSSFSSSAAAASASSSSSSTTSSPGLALFGPISSPSVSDALDSSSFSAPVFSTVIIFLGLPRFLGGGCFCCLASASAASAIARDFLCLLRLLLPHTSQHSQRLNHRNIFLLSINQSDSNLQYFLIRVAPRSRTT